MLNTRKLFVLTFSLLFIVLVCLNHGIFNNVTHKGIHEKTYVIIIYGSRYCQECNLLKETLQNISYARIVFIDLSKRRSLLYFQIIVELLSELEPPVMIPCPTCVPKEVLIKSINMLVPLTAIFEHNELKIIVIGSHSVSFWKNLLKILPTLNTTYCVGSGFQIVIRSVLLRRTFRDVFLSTLDNPLHNLSLAYDLVLLNVPLSLIFSIILTLIVLFDFNFFKAWYVKAVLAYVVLFLLYNVLINLLEIKVPYLADLSLHLLLYASSVILIYKLVKLFTMLGLIPFNVRGMNTARNIAASISRNIRRVLLIICLLLLISPNENVSSFFSMITLLCRIGILYSLASLMLYFLFFVVTPAFLPYLLNIMLYALSRSFQEAHLAEHLSEVLTHVILAAITLFYTLSSLY